MNLRDTGADVIGDGEAAAPTFRSNLAGQRRKQRLCVTIRNWQNWNFRDCRGVFDLQALGVFRSPHAWREWITRIKRHIGDAAALHSIRRAIGAGGKSLSADKSILMGIGVNQAADSTVFGGNFGLDAAPGVVVARDDNLALHGNAHAIELLVVFGHAVVDVDERCGHVAVNRVSVVGGKLFGLLTRRGVLWDRRLLKLGDEFGAAFNEFNNAFLGRWEENVKLFDVRVKTELLELGGDPLGVVLVGLRTDVVRSCGKFLHVRAEIFGTGNGAEFLFPLTFGAGRFGGVAEERRLIGDNVVANGYQRSSHQENGCNSGGAIH